MTMPDTSVLIALLAGFVLMLVSGEALVSGALALGRRMGLSPLMAGLLIVGIGASLPEFMVSVNSAATGRPGLAIGNIVGSNIANVFLVMALPALLMPFQAGGTGQRRTIGVLLVAVIAWIGITVVRPLDPMAGIFLLLIFVGYFGLTLTGALRAHASGQEHGVRVAPEKGLHWAFGLLLVPAGIVGLVFAARQIIQGGTGLAEHFNVPQEWIGLTVVAVGTSLPELGANLAAVWRRKGDLMVGNIAGASIFNLLASGGVVGLLGPIKIAPIFPQYDYWAMGLAALVLTALVFTKARVGRLIGVLLLLIYAVYIFGLVSGFNLLGLFPAASA